MKDIYALTITDREEVEFQCLISEDCKYFRVQIDELGYEEMINQLINDGYSYSIKKSIESVEFEDNIYEKPIYEEHHEEFNRPQDLYNALIDDGFECTLYEQSEFDDIIEVVADGQDLGLELITNTNKVKISTAINNLFKAANNSDYEPVEKEKASSYSLTLSDPGTNPDIKENIIKILNDLKTSTIDATEFFKKKHYYTFLNSFVELASIKHLDILKLIAGDSDDEKISLDKDEIRSIKSAVDMVYHTKPFDYKKGLDDQITAFEENVKGELKFKLLFAEGTFNDKMRVCFVENEALYSKIKTNKDNILQLRGHYKDGIRTVVIESASILHTHNANT